MSPRPRVDFAELPSPSACRIGRQYPADQVAEEIDNAEASAARAELADLACAVSDAVDSMEAEPGFSSLPRQHPARRLRGALSRARIALGGPLHALEAVTLSPAAVSRVIATASQDELARAALCVLLHRKKGT